MYVCGIHSRVAIVEEQLLEKCSFSISYISTPQRTDIMKYEKYTETSTVLHEQNRNAVSCINDIMKVFMYTLIV